MAKEIEAKLKISAEDRTAKAFNNIEERLKKAEKMAQKANRMERQLQQTQKATAVAAQVHRRETVLAGGAGGGMMVAGAGRLAAGLSLAVAGMAVAGAIKDYAALERQMTRIGIAAGATDQETKAATADVAKFAYDLALPLDQAVAGLDALVATGKTMPEAMAFLPAILRTAQATGAATDEMAQSAASLATSMKVPAEQMQKAFDALVVGGQLGQFELEDMARYLPSLTASAAKLGYTGKDGVERLVAMLQTVRQVSGTSEEAATAVRDAFEKMLSPTVATAFKKHGVNIGNVLEGAAKRGQNQFEAVIGTLDNLTKGMSDTRRNMLISSIFTESDSRRAVVAMMNLQEVYERYRKEIDGAGGATEKNLQRVLGDTQASVDRLAGSWGRLWSTIGRGADSAGASTAMESISGGLNHFLDKVDDNKAKDAAIVKALDGKTWWERMSILARSGPDDLERLAREGGYVPSAAVREEQAATAQKEQEQLRNHVAKLERDIATAKEAEARNLFPAVPGEMQKMQADLDKLRAALAEREVAQAAAVPSLPGGVPLPQTDPRRPPLGAAPYPLPHPLRASPPEPIPFPVPDPRGGHSMAVLSGFERVEQDRLPPLPELRLENLVAAERPPLSTPVREEVGAALKGLSDINDRIRAMYAPADGGAAGGGPAALGGAIGDAGETLRRAMEGAGAPLREAGERAGGDIDQATGRLESAIRSAADRLERAGEQAASAISSARVQVPSAPAMRSVPPTNFNPGQSMPTVGTPGG